MKKINILLITLILVLTSCSSQVNKLDLSKIRIPYNSNNLINNNLEVKKSQNDFDTYIGYSSENINQFTFSQINFKKDASDEFWSPTTFSFQVDTLKKEMTYLDFAKEESVKMFEEVKYLNEIKENLPL